MLSNVMSLISERLTSLCWISRYCELSVIARRTIRDKNDRSIVETYPVSCKCDQSNCFDTGRYKDLVPDAKYASLAYWEQVGNIRSEKYKKRIYKYETSLDLIVWLNLPKLGIDECHVNGLVLTDLQNVLSGKFNSNDAIGSIDVSLAFQHSHNSVRLIFNKYAYGNVEHLFFYPYQALAFRYDISWLGMPDCLPGLECSEPIECVIV